MNKKFLSAILFGALMVTSTGTFVSCKDYDDDIKGLQEQIDKLATKDDLKAQIATLQAGLTTAAKDASDAVTKATAAETAAKAAGDAAAAAKAAADKAVAEAKAEAIKAVQAEIEALKEEVNASTEASLAEMRKEVAEATKKVEDIIGKIADMVTSVELLSSWTTQNSEAWKFYVDFMTTIEKENVFSTGVTNAITFTKDKQVQTGDKILVRVSPTNAVLTPEMISLTNSKGQNLNDFITVQKVEKYNGLLSRATTSNTGLWEITVALNNYDEKAFDAVATTKVGDAVERVLFAVHVNNTLSTAATREVTSAYDLGLFWNEYQSANDLNFFVNEKNVAKIRNRYSKSDNGTATTYKELAWKGDAAVKATDLNSDGTPKATSNAVLATTDRRDGQPLYPAVQGKALTIALSTATDKVTAPKNIRAIYVVLDKANAVESAPSEVNAWDSYQYTGLNTVVEGTSTEITINGNNIIDDVVGFRVYAVNYDGTLVDPDGKAFYVKLGKEATAWSDVNTVITPSVDASIAVDMTESAKQAVTLTKLTGAYEATWTTDKKNDNVDELAFKAYFVDANGKLLFSTTGEHMYEYNTNIATVDFSKVAKIYTRPTAAKWYLYDDNKAYDGVFTVKNQDGFVLATLNISMTKTLPTTLPAGFSIKDKQVINGIYNCYMIADNWAAEKATEGSMPIENLIKFGDGVAKQYVVTFAESVENDKKLEDVNVNGASAIVVKKSFIDNTKEHATTIVYDYGQVSSEKNEDGNYKNVTINAATFKTVYCCFYKKEIHTWAWATTANLGVTKLPYSTELTYGTTYDVPTAAHIWGANGIDGVFTKALSNAYGNSLKIESAKLVSDATQAEDYFKVDFSKETGIFTAIKTDLGSNPKENVPSTLTIKCKDSYSHDVVIELKMTVKPRK